MNKKKNNIRSIKNYVIKYAITIPFFFENARGFRKVL